MSNDTKPEPFTRTEINEATFHGWAYAVHGYWPTSVVRVTRSKDFRTGGWRPPEINWSSGGRSPESEPGDIEAARCFAAAILDACEQAELLLKH